MGVELFGGPLEVTVDPRAAVQLEEVAKSLSRMEREMLKVAMADQRTAGAVEDLSKKFRAQFISADQLRTGLRSLAGELPRTAEEFKRADQAAAKFQDRIGKLNERANLAHSMTAMRHGFDMVREGARMAAEAVEHVSERIAEYQRLARVQRELSVNFAQAQGRSERFVSQENVAGLAEHFASAHVNLNQQQLNAMTQGAARLAQMQDTSVELQGQRLFSAIVGGELEVLRRIGPEMARLSGQSHTAQERLQAFIRTVRELGPATEDTATALERFKESLKMGERTFFTAVKDELEGLAQNNGPLAAVREQFGHLAGDMEGWGRRTAQAIALVATGTLALASPWIALGRIFALTGQNAIAAMRAIRSGTTEGAGFATPQEFAAIRRDMGDQIVAFMEMARRARDRGTAGTAGSDGLAGAGGGAPPVDPITDEMGAAAEGRGGGSLGTGEFDGGRVGEGAIGRGFAPGGHGVFTRHGHSMFRQQRGGHHGPRRPTIDQLMTRAFHDRGANARVNTMLGLRSGLDPLEIPGEREEIESYNQSEDKNRTLRRAMDQENRENTQSEEDKQKALRGDQSRDRTSLRSGLEQMAERYSDSWRRARDGIVGSLESIGEAFTKHVDAIVTGRETIGEALQGMLSDFLKSAAKRASVAAAEEIAASLASLALGDFRGAGLHAAAAAGYFTVSGVAGAAAGALAPSGGASAGGASRASSASRDSAADISASRRGRSGGDGGTSITIQFGAPVVAGNPAQAGRLIANMVRDAVVREGVRIPSLMANA